ncbi:hypothetical protein RBB50_007377 [Rhinocladiella similis]
MTVQPAFSDHLALCLARIDFEGRLSGFEDPPVGTEDDGRLLGIRGAQSGDGPAFTSDLLHIEVRGPVGLHLSIVDVPGLISVSNEKRTEDDVEMVHRIVDSFISDPRDIIIAAVQAGNDIANPTPY